MSTVPAVWKEQRFVESFEVDLKGRLKPHVFFAFLTNSAWKHASLTAHGYQDLLDRNQMWVLVKFQLSVRRFPRWSEQIVIETWGKGVQKLYALRDFIITTASGEKLASATSAWLVLDRESHRPVRIDQMIFPWTPGKSELDTDLQKVPELAEASEERARFHVVFSDLDVNGHVTAARYLQWMVDSQPRELLEEKQPCSLELSFLAEAMLGDEVAVLSEGSDGHELCGVRRVSDRKELCRARMEWA